MKVKVDWDLDGLTAEEANVPEIVELPADLVGNSEEIADYLSDTYGWCMLGWVALTEGGNSVS